MVQVDKGSLISNNASIPGLQNATARTNLHHNKDHKEGEAQAASYVTNKFRPSGHKNWCGRG